MDKNKPTGNGKLMARTKKKNIGSILLTLGMVFLFIFLIAGAYTWSSKINLLKVEKIRIRGNTIITDREILDLITGTNDESLFDIDRHSIRKAIEVHPYVAAARLSRRFPHLLKVEIVERKPIAMVNLDELILLDKNGIVLPAVPRIFEFQIPALSGFNSEKGLYPIGEQVLSIKLKKTITILDKIQMNYPGLFIELSEITLNKEDEFTFILTSNPTVINFGDKDITRKLVTLMAFKNSLSGKKALTDYSYLDLRYAKQIIAKEWS